MPERTAVVRSRTQWSPGLRHMTDDEITRRCAASVGVILLGPFFEDSGCAAYGRSKFDNMTVTFPYNPLRIDSQAFELIERHYLHIDQRPGKQVSVQPPSFEEIVTRTDGDLKRAICECVALMQKKAK